MVFYATEKKTQGKRYKIADIHFKKDNTYDRKHNIKKNI